MPIIISLILGVIWLASLFYRAMFLGPFTWVEFGLYALSSYLVLCFAVAVFFYIYYIVVSRREDD